MMFLRSFLFAYLAFVVRAYEQDDFDFNLDDALNEDPAKPQKANDFDLSDALDNDSHVPKGQDDFGFNLEDALSEDPAKPQGNDNGFDLSDALRDDTVKSPDADGFDLRDADGFDLRDALDDSYVKQTAGGDFHDSDLEQLKDSGYKPEKTKPKDQDLPAETDLFSELLMSILDRTSEHFKKICFSLMEMLKDLYNSQQD